jgi:hypothetical protein
VNGGWIGDGASSADGRDRNGESDVRSGLNRIDWTTLAAARSAGISSSIESLSGRTSKASFGLVACSDRTEGEEGPAMGCSSRHDGDPRACASSRDSDRGSGARWMVGEFRGPPASSSLESYDIECSLTFSSPPSSWSAKSDSLIPPKSSAISAISAEFKLHAYLLQFQSPVPHLAFLESRPIPANP